MKESRIEQTVRSPFSGRVYDAVVSLGAWCQTGGIMWHYGLKAVNSPFDNFGIKQWTNLMDVLDRNFEDYWNEEKIAIGKPDVYFSLRKNENSLIYKVYDNNYNMISTHNFDEEINSPNELPTFKEFRERLQVLVEVFRRQCDVCESMLFVCKALDHPEERTTVSPNDINRLISSLERIRKGKHFDLALAVPQKDYAVCREWVQRTGLDSRVAISPWSITWNSEPNAEWDIILKGVSVTGDQYRKIKYEYLGQSPFSLEDCNRLCDIRKYEVAANSLSTKALKLMDGTRILLGASVSEVHLSGDSDEQGILVEVSLGTGWRQGILDAQNTECWRAIDLCQVAAIQFDFKGSEELLNRNTWSRMDLVIQSEGIEWKELPVYNNADMVPEVWSRIRISLSKTSFPEGLKGLWALHWTLNSGSEIGGRFEIRNLAFLTI